VRPLPVRPLAANHFFVVLVLVLAVTGCLPFRRAPSAGGAIDRAEPIAPIEPLILSATETIIERFDPPGPSSASLLELSLKTTAQNVNPFAITLTRIDYELFLQDKKVTSGSFTPNLQVAANSQEPLTLALNTPLTRTDLIKAAAQTYTGTPLPFRLEGTLGFTSNNYGFTTRKLVLLTGELNSRQQLELPKLSLAENQVFMLREGVPVIRTLVRAENPGDVGYFLYGKDLEVLLNNVPLAKQDVSPIPIQAGQVSSFELLFYPDTADLGAEAATILDAALQGTDTMVEVRGQLFVDVLGVDTFEIPSWSITNKFVN
jgi:LEA14-like dessication related protein